MSKPSKRFRSTRLQDFFVPILLIILVLGLVAVILTVIFAALGLIPV